MRQDDRRCAWSPASRSISEGYPPNRRSCRQPHAGTRPRLSYALYPHLTVFGNIAFGLRLRKAPKAEIDLRVREAADILGLTEFLLQPKPRALSGRPAPAGRSSRLPLPRSLPMRSPGLSLPCRDWLFIIVVALLVVPIQMALIPIFSLDHPLGLPTRSPVSSSSTRRSVCRSRSSYSGTSPSGSRGISLRRRGSTRSSRSSASSSGSILPLGLPAIASLAIFQFLWVWKPPPRRADVRARHAADHGRDLLAPAAVRARHSSSSRPPHSSRWRFRSSSSSSSSATSSRACSPAP